MPSFRWSRDGPDKLVTEYAAQCKKVLGRFVNFVQAQNPKAVEIALVTRKLAQAFMGAEAERGVGAKTWNDTLKLLRATFKYLLPAGAGNPFYNMVTKDAETVFRKPFTPEELKAILDAAQDDDFIRPIIITGMCTAMRRGDCCRLKWKDVDLARRFITVKTAKTGQTVSIPIFPLLLGELASLPTQGEELVFPEQAEMYKTDRKLLLTRPHVLSAAWVIVSVTGRARSPTLRARCS